MAHDHCNHEHHDHHHAHDENLLPSKYEQAFAKYNLHLHDEEVLATVDKLLADHLEEYRTPETFISLLRTIELTTLKVTDSAESILKMVEKYNDYASNHPDLPPFATICVYPRFAKIVAESLEVDGTEVAVVTGSFPSAQSFLEVKTVETALAIKDGAEQCDMVLSVGSFLSGDYETCADEISEIKAVCGDKDLKVILETGALQTAENIKRASILAMYAGADLIKTSTGKIEPTATPLAAYVMCQAIKEYYQETGRRVGFKASGGVSTPEDALVYYTIVREVLGKEWIDAHLFRIGTSSLAPRLIKAVTGEDVGKF
ncbi:MAG: deoxyribose-phosphate aldolase [Alloprevotella sp.]|nr:deoxyribose-phosphate aldolase [Alloprevotella sp.]